MTNEKIIKIIVILLCLVGSAFIGWILAYLANSIEKKKTKHEPATAKFYRIEFKNVHAMRIVSAEKIKLDKQGVAFIKAKQIAAWFPQDEIRYIELLQNNKSESEAKNEKL